MEEKHTEELEQKQPREEKPAGSSGKELLSMLKEMTAILAVMLLLFTFVVRIVQVDGPSMYDTLVDGDYVLLLSNTLYREPKQGDIVVVTLEDFRGGESIIKRVIATEGQTVDIDFEASVVYVDGVPLDEPYTYSPTTNDEGTRFPLVVQEGQLFLLGDNRNASMDSRSPQIGLVDKRELVGKALLILLPGTNGGTEQADFGRIGSVYGN